VNGDIMVSEFVNTEMSWRSPSVLSIGSLQKLVSLWVNKGNGKEWNAQFKFSRNDVKNRMSVKPRWHVKRVKVQTSGASQFGI
jgi:hypothetical protein